MKKSVRAAAAVVSAAAMLSALALPASAGSLSKEELIEKYGSLCEFTEAVPVSGEFGTEPLALERIGDAAYAPQTGTVIESGSENGFFYELLDNGGARITGLDPETADLNVEVLQIPETAAGSPVTEIGYAAFRRAFEQLPALREIVLPDSVEFIAERAFTNAFGEYDDMFTVPHDTYKINIPANAKFIGYRAYSGCGFAAANGSAGYTIVLPESLEYISSQAFDQAVGSRSKGDRVTVTMPQSLVMMSDNTFHTDLRWRYFGGRNITTTQYEHTFSDDTPEEYLPLLLDVYGNGFEGGASNVVSMRDMLWEYLGIPADIFAVEYDWQFMNRKFRDDNLSMIDYDLADAAVYAPDLIPESIRSQYTAQQSKPQESILAGDLNVDGKVDIMDAIALARITAEDKEVNVTEAGLQNADVNSDGAVTADDLNALLAQLAG